LVQIVMTRNMTLQQVSADPDLLNQVLLELLYLIHKEMIYILNRYHGLPFMISPQLYSSGRLNKFAPLQALCRLHPILPRESVPNPSSHYRLS